MPNNITKCLKKTIFGIKKNVIVSHLKIPKFHFITKNNQSAYNTECDMYECEHNIMFCAMVMNTSA
jgi:hypothetical protein